MKKRTTDPYVLQQWASQALSDLGITQAEAAKILGVTQTAISKAVSHRDPERYTSLQARIIREVAKQKLIGPIWEIEDDT